jgi:hypothetical protein
LSTEKRKKHSGFAALNARINGGTGNGQPISHIFTRIVKITLTENVENENNA